MKKATITPGNQTSLSAGRPFLFMDPRYRLEGSASGSRSGSEVGSSPISVEIGKLEILCQRIREMPLECRADWLRAAIELARTLHDPNEQLLYACLRESVNEAVAGKNGKGAYRMPAMSGYQAQENENEEAIDLREVCRQNVSGRVRYKFDMYPPEKPNASTLRMLKQLSEYVRGDLERGEPHDAKSIAAIATASEKDEDAEVRRKAADELLGILRGLIR